MRRDEKCKIISYHGFCPQVEGLLCFSSVQSLSHVQLFATPWIAACQASLSITKSQRSPKLMSIKSVMPSSHLILCCPLLLLPPIPPSIRVFANESTLHIRWPKYWSFNFNISPSNEHPGLISFRMDWLDLLAVQGLSRVFSNTTVQKHQFFGAQVSSWEMLGWMKHKLESRLLGETSITSDMQITPPLRQKMKN